MHSYPIMAFDGGLNSKYEPHLIGDNESPDCLNVYANDLGGVQTRYGSTKFNTTAVGSFVNHGLHTARYGNGTNQTMLGWWNGSLFQLVGTSTFTTVPSAQSVFTAGQMVDAVMYQDLMFFGNGGSNPYKWNGAEFTRHGIPQPNSTPGVATAGAGNVPIGDVQYKVSYVNSYVVEGDVSAGTTTFAVAASAIVSLTSIPLAPTSFGVNSRKIYRSDANTSGTFKLVTTISDNTTTTYTDDTASGSLGAAAPDDQGEPPTWKYAKVLGERLFLFDPADPGYVWFTELGNPFVVKAENFVKVGDSDGEVVRGLGIQDNSIVAPKDVCAWFIYMPDTDEANWVPIKTNARVGCFSHYAMLEWDNALMMIGRSLEGAVNFHALSAGQVLPDQTGLTIGNVQTDSKSDKIEPEVMQFNTTLLPNAVGIRFNNKLWFAVPYGTSSTTNNRIFVFDWVQRDKDRRQGAWWIMSGLSIAAFTIYDGKLYGASSAANGFVYRLDVPGVYSDDGAAIDSYFWTKEFEGLRGHEENHKDWRYVKLTVETLGDWYMGFSHKVDSLTGAGERQQIDLNPGGSIWGTLVWGVGLWGGGKVRDRRKVELGTAAGTRIQFKFDNGNTAGQAFKVVRGTIFYNARGVR